MKKKTIWTSTGVAGLIGVAVLIGEGFLTYRTTLGVLPKTGTVKIKSGGGGVKAATLEQEQKNALDIRGLQVELNYVKQSCDKAHQKLDSMSVILYDIKQTLAK